MYAQQLQRVNQLKNQVFRPEPSPIQMITQTERTMTSESDSPSPSQPLSLFQTAFYTHFTHISVNGGVYTIKRIRLACPEFV